VLDDVKKIAEEVCARENCVLWDIELKGSGKGRILRVSIEGKDHQVTIQDCERVSKGLNLLLDVNDVVPGGPYSLEVSSPGIERPLREAWQFSKSIGQPVEVLLNEAIPVDKGDPFRLRGKLVAVENETVTIDAGQNQEQQFQISNVKRAKTLFEDKKQNNKRS
jgi:ribosome maturation factor RimP